MGILASRPGAAVCAALLAFVCLPAGAPSPGVASAQDPEPTMLVSGLQVTRVAGGLVTPTAIAFIGRNDFLVTEKNTGQVRRIREGFLFDDPVLDLGVNNASERGLLGIALDPAFPSQPFVYLYWTCRAPAPSDPFVPSLVECPDAPDLGADSSNVLETPLLGNRVDRFVWNGSTLVWERNLLKLRSFQNDGAPSPAGQGDAGQMPAGNHDGGVIKFGPDGKLYVVIGDVGRRGWMQNLRFGPKEEQVAPEVPDDQFGGPAPDDAHWTGVIIRINPDGTVPADNPFAAFTSGLGPEVDENIRLTFSYGHRNSFGMSFDPRTGRLWMTENGDDSYDEINLVERGFNSGWIQTMGPIARVADLKAIETQAAFFGLQQQRFPPTLLPDTEAEARARLFLLPGAAFGDPKLSWRFAVAPAAIGFAEGAALGIGFLNDMFVGLSVPAPLGGPLLRFDLSADRRSLLAPTVVENAAKNDLGPSGANVIGRDFGIVTDIRTGPSGSLYVVSLTKGAVYEISRRPIQF